MEYLKELGFSDEEIVKLSKTISDKSLSNIELYETRVINITNYLKSLGIMNIKDIFYNCSYIFSYSLDELKKLFSMCKEENIVSLINEDVDNIDLLF